MKNNHYSRSKRDHQALKKDLADWLPEKIFNAHTHVAGKSNLELPDEPLISREILNHGLKLNTGIYKKILPGHDFIFLAIPLPFNNLGINPESANDFLCKKIIKKNIYGALLWTGDTTKLSSQVKRYKIKALKFHPRLFNLENRQVSLGLYLTKTVLDFATKHRLSLLLEMPNGWRTREIATLKKIYQKYQVKIIIPHLGQTEKNFILTPGTFMASGKIFAGPKEEANFKALKKFKNLYLDISMVNNQKLLNSALKIIGSKRIFWGDDYPYGFTPKITTDNYNKNKISRDLYKLINSQNETVDGWQFVDNFYQQLSKVKTAIQEVSNDDLTAKKNIFLTTAQVAYNIQIFK